MNTKEKQTVTDKTEIPTPKRTKGERAAELILECGSKNLDEAAEIIAAGSPWVAKHLAEKLTENAGS